MFVLAQSAKKSLYKLSNNKVKKGYILKYSICNIFSNIYLLLLCINLNFIIKNKYINIIYMLYYQIIKIIYLFILYNITIILYFNKQIIILFYISFILHIISLYYLLKSIKIKKEESINNTELLKFNKESNNNTD